MVGTQPKTSEHDVLLLWSIKTHQGSIKGVIEAKSSQRLIDTSVSYITQRNTMGLYVTVPRFEGCGDRDLPCCVFQFIFANSGDNIEQLCS